MCIINTNKQYIIPYNIVLYIDKIGNIQYTFIVPILLRTQRTFMNKKQQTNFYSIHEIDQITNSTTKLIIKLIVNLKMLNSEKSKKLQEKE